MKVVSQSFTPPRPSKQAWLWIGLLGAIASFIQAFGGLIRVKA